MNRLRKQKLEEEKQRDLHFTIRFCEMQKKRKISEGLAVLHNIFLDQG